MEKLPNRQSIRRPGWDYTGTGWYFVTINAKGGRPLFGTIVNGRMVLSDMGRVAQACWLELPAHFHDAQIDEFVVMPNHVHGIVRILPKGLEGLDMSSPYKTSPFPIPKFGEPIAGALGTIVGAYKAAVSRMVGRRGLIYQAHTQARTSGPIWHRNYWDVIVPNEKALANIRQYIRENPRNYHAGWNLGEPCFVGNRALMENAKLAFLASRGKAALPRELVVMAGEVIISSFLSPIEQTIFQENLKHKKPMIWIKSWGSQLESAFVRIAIEEGRLLVVSPFDDSIEAPSSRRAVWCNQYVLAHCDRVVIGHLNPGGILDCILSEADPDMEITYL